MIQRSDRGFSLAEVLMTVVITTVIGGVAGAAMVVGLRNLDDQNSRLAGSNDTQLIAGYFTSDVASAVSISTTGTKAHAAPSVTPTAENTRLVSFWSLKLATTLTVPDGMAAGWTTLGTAQFRSGMADESTPAAGETGNRVATSAIGTSSIAHSVSLAPSSTTAPVRRSLVATGTTSGTDALAVTRPSGWSAGDRLLAHVVVSGGSATTVQANGWTVVDSRDSGTTMKSLILQRVAASETSYGFTFTGGTANASRQAAIGIAAYSNVLADPVLGVNAKVGNVNPCGGETPVLLLSWADRHADPANDVAVEVAYNTTTVGDETHLIRQRCTAPAGTEMSRIPSSQQTLATNLTPATAFASCASSSTATTVATTSTSSTSTSSTTSTTTVGATSSDACTYLPVTVTLSVTEPPERSETNGRTYLLRATTRTDREVVE